jgi:hypothetical protein
MKKSTLFLACCIGLMFFASCKKEPVAPTISLLAEEGCVIEDAQVYSGNEILVGFTGTGENLTQIEIVLSLDGTILANHTGDLSSQKTAFTYKHAFTVEAVGKVTIRGTVYDANGTSASKTFDIYFNEKPNTKFLGHYEGDALFTGIIKVNVMGDSINQEVTDRAIPIILDLRDGETITEVIGNCKINDQEMELKGAVDGDTVTFEAVSTTVTSNYEMNGFSIPLSMTITYTVTGVLNNGTLTLNGSCNGDGVIPLLNGTTYLEGSIGGSLAKQ